MLPVLKFLGLCALTLIALTVVAVMGYFFTLLTIELGKGVFKNGRNK